jgi:hypothetical protein
MVPTPGPNDFCSYTDETSLPFARCKVSIHGQILPEFPFTWYDTLRRAAPNHQGEFKSALAVTVFQGLSSDQQRNVFNTLRTARIHITDPRPYYEDITPVLSPLLPKGADAITFLSRLSHEQHIARLQEMARAFLAERILVDRPAQRLATMCLCAQMSQSIFMDDYRGMAAEPVTSFFNADLDVDLSEFSTPKSNIVDRVSFFASKSSPAFFDAVEAFDTALEDGNLDSHYTWWMLHRHLIPSHAYDRGAPFLELVNNDRHKVLAVTDRHAWFYPHSQPLPLEEIDSSDSLLIRVADIAAGIAREIWSRGHLIDVVRHFHCVMYNGERLTESKAADIKY